ncbi:hypothetical protein D910_04690 [Dendroctonus ponderosae]|uniref:DDE Tnp4 domain-containing protein n=1 Tax=Dendroctonus ponderosae TaxID=77166 RepID=U4UBF6_DENPD|nr:hypothetical protein D910_04690 [Dendroctonus ponderosae]
MYLGGSDAEVFKYRKGYFSINVQAIGDAGLKLMNVVARWPGSTHDATIFNNSKVKHEFENNLFPDSVSLGDGGYNIRPYLLTPLQQPANRAEQLYNESHIRTRNIIERIFPVLAYGCRLKIDTVLIIIIATAVLHNICGEQNEEEPPDPEDLERFIHLMQEDEVPNIPLAFSNILSQGNQNRRDLIDSYFRFIDE